MVVGQVKSFEESAHGCSAPPSLNAGDSLVKGRHGLSSPSYVQPHMLSVDGRGERDEGGDIFLLLDGCHEGENSAHGVAAQDNFLFGVAALDPCDGSGYIVFEEGRRIPGVVDIARVGFSLV